MLTGDVPFHAETPMAVMLKQIAEPPPAPRLKNPDISAEVEQVTLKAMAKMREDRYTHAVEFAAAYEAALIRQRPCPSGRLAAYPQCRSLPR